MNDESAFDTNKVEILLPVTESLVADCPMLLDRLMESQALRSRAEAGDPEAIAELETRKRSAEEYRLERKREVDERWDQAPKWDAETIVRSLAAGGPPRDSESGDCSICDELFVYRDHDPNSGEDLNLSHTPDCDYRQAVGWVERNPEHA